MKSLLGVDTESVTIRVADAMQEAQKELMRRLIEPVRAMATRLSEQPKEGKSSPRFNDTLVGNLKEIAQLAPKLNIAGDPKIDEFVAEIGKLTAVEPQVLRDAPTTRQVVAQNAMAVLKKLEGYDKAARLHHGEGWTETTVKETFDIHWLEGE